MITDNRVTTDQLMTVSVEILRARGIDPYGIDTDPCAMNDETGLENWETPHSVSVACCAIRALGLSLPGNLDRHFPIPELKVD